MAPTARIAVIIGTALLFQIGLFIGERLYPPTFNPLVWLIAILLMASLVGSWGLVIILGLCDAPVGRATGRHHDKR
jgi:hypothetical protein